MKHLDSYGWNPHFAALLDPQTDTLENVARVVQEHKEAYLVRSRLGNVWAEISGKMRHEGAVRSDFPAVGDWVMLRGLREEARNKKQEAEKQRGPVQIYRILPRRTILARRLDTGDEQVLATNVDVVFLGTSLDDNFNVRRLERYLTMARESGARPVVLLTKADLCPDASQMIAQTRQILGSDGGGGGVDVHAISVVSGLGLDAMKAYLKHGVTGVILGSSGVGKSTLVNTIADADIQDMMQVREFDDKGRHCTTFRHLVSTPMGGLIIDTPGLRGLTVGEATDALLSTFEDIEALAATCKFSDCRHDTEPGCAIKAALESGSLDAGRLEGYRKLRREVAAMGQRENRVAGRKQRKLDKRSGAAKEERDSRKWGRRR